MTDEIKGQAEHLSKLNDVRVAVLDLYKGKIGVDAEEASHVRTSFHGTLLCLFKEVQAHNRFCFHMHSLPTDGCIVRADEAIADAAHGRPGLQAGSE